MIDPRYSTVLALITVSLIWLINDANKKRRLRTTVRQEKPDIPGAPKRIRE